MINFEGLVRHGVIAREDLELFRFADAPAQALALLQEGIDLDGEAATPAIARSTTPASPAPVSSRKRDAE